MNALSLGLFGLVNILMICPFLLKKGRIYEFPLWAGLLAMGWFYPQAISALRTVENYPDGAYSQGLIFATFCTLAIWWGYNRGLNKQPEKPSYLDMKFNVKRLIPASAVLCMAGFFFQWKLNHLPAEVLAQTRWSGAAVKYLFLASIFQFGFLALWLLYLRQNNPLRIDLLVFIVPSLFTIISGAINGRRAIMMNTFSYIFVSLWFARRKMLPRWALLAALFFGLTLISAIGVYRGVMKQAAELPLGERVQVAVKATLDDAFGEDEDESHSRNHEFDNYIYGRAAHSKTGSYDWGITHWNGVIFNYVPGQIVGAGVKKALMFPTIYSMSLAKEEYGHIAGVGTTLTGYLDAFSSFSWLGFIKFWFVGFIMGVLYRRAMTGSFLGMLLYVYLLGTAMHAISHGTHAILFSKWIYFFALGYPAFLWARSKPGVDPEAPIV